MVSFRYHLVSLAAVLLALAAGVVLGAGPLDGPLGGSGALSDEQQAEVDALQAQIDSLEARVAYDDAAAAPLVPVVVPDRLAGRSVVVVVTPGTDPALVDELTEAVQLSGAALTGAVTIQNSWVDPAEATVLAGLAEQLVPPEITLPSGGVYAEAGAALASALVTNVAIPPTEPDPASVALLTGFEEGGFVTTTGTPAVRAQLALVVSPAGPELTAPEPLVDAATVAADALLPLVAALDSGQGAVLAGPEGSTRPGGLVSVLRASGPVRRVVSSVDVADLPTGVIATVLALAQQSGGTTGQYGLGPGADAAMPPVTFAGG